ncbi:hypothetical protein O9929_21540 [Vibrio lentus]|nr:hypothetical protein [Vibrio lentus]
MARGRTPALNDDGDVSFSDITDGTAFHDHSGQRDTGHHASERRTDHFASDADGDRRQRSASLPRRSCWRMRLMWTIQTQAGVDNPGTLTGGGSLVDNGNGHVDVHAGAE